jgi:methanogenic corrinoid protein MtbC1
MARVAFLILTSYIYSSTILKIFIFKGDLMNPFVLQIAEVIERGKVNQAAPYPPDLKGQDGADELGKKALETGLSPSEVLDGCMMGMKAIGEKFSRNEVFVPQLLMSAKAMSAVMVHLQPYFQSGDVKRKGVFVIGTVAGDLHDIGKKLVTMVIEGNGWEVKDLGVDVSTEKFASAIEENPGCALGLSALLTTTMVNMEETVKAIKKKYPSVPVLIGGAPVTQDFADKILADGYASDPQKAVSVLESLLHK